MKKKQIQIPDSRVLLVLSAFTKALFHKIRSPLSVISNDLTYLNSKFPDENIERTLNKCFTIGNIMRSSEVNLGAFENESCDVVEILKDAGFVDSIAENKIIIFARSEHVRIAFKELFNLLLDMESKKLHLSLSSNGRIEIKFVFFLTVFLHHETYPQTHQSFSEFINISLNQDRISAPAIDARLWATGAEIEIKEFLSEEGLKCEAIIIFPERLL